MTWKCSLDASVISGHSVKTGAFRGTTFDDAFRMSLGGAAPSGVDALSLRGFCSSGDMLGDLDLVRDLEPLLRSGLGNALSFSCFTKLAAPRPNSCSPALTFRFSMPSWTRSSSSMVASGAYATDRLEYCGREDALLQCRLGTVDGVMTMNSPGVAEHKRSNK